MIKKSAAMTAPNGLINRYKAWRAFIKDDEMKKCRHNAGIFYRIIPDVPLVNIILHYEFNLKKTNNPLIPAVYFQKIRILLNYNIVNYEI
jgi:hypothetical protein